jgi:hypothetical protein
MQKVKNAASGKRKRQKGVEGPSSAESAADEAMVTVAL